MSRRITFAFMLCLAVWVALTAVRLERLNAQAGFYLPRRDGGADGEWRVSRQNTARDRLRGLIISAGLLQYLFAAGLLALAVFHLWRGRPAQPRWLAAGAGLVGVAALLLAFYRGYYTSLGW